MTNPIAVNGTRINTINSPTTSMRQQNKGCWLPQIKFKVFNSDGKLLVQKHTKRIQNIKFSVIHKKGYIVIGVNNWHKTPQYLKFARKIFSDQPWIAIINKFSYYTNNIQQCVDDLNEIGITPYIHTSWNIDKIMKQLPTHPVYIGLQKTNYIVDLYGEWQTYNKVPGYVYPAEYMKPHQYSTKLCSY